MRVDAEWLHRENARTARCLHEAKLRLSSASLEDIDYASKRELDKSLVRQLGSCRWVAEHQNVVITGATGTGKTYLACALAQTACRKGYKALYRRAPRLFDELTLAHADGSYARVLARLAKVGQRRFAPNTMTEPGDHDGRNTHALLHQSGGVEAPRDSGAHGARVFTAPHSFRTENSKSL
ncbi:ATP-binding protein [Archangium violaceum]|uniref:ATP-binding protein n=1 Tax=Archangium violaceum TaxID=83451 RepID=UPI002B2C2672|nr:ATP-binding protein [Archangium gephyra]